MVSSFIFSYVYVLFTAGNRVIALFSNGTLNSYDAIGRHFLHICQTIKAISSTVIPNGTIIFLFAREHSWDIVSFSFKH